MKVIGHRGARGLAPENTLAALRKGLEHHADILEFDLRVTKDGIAILSHNSYLHEGSGKRLVIKKTTYNELKEHKADLARFDEVLAEFGNKTHLYIEVKRGVDIKPIVKQVKAFYDEDYGRYWLGSKSQKTLRALHEALPEAAKIVIEPWSGVRAHRRARQVDTKLLAMKKLWLWTGFIRAVSRSGYQLYAYTLNNPKKAARWEKHGLAGVVTDYPDTFEKY